MKKEFIMSKKSMKKIDDTHIMQKVLVGSLFVFTIAILSSTLGVLVDGIVIANCLGVDSTAAYGLTSPLFTMSAAIAGLFSAGSQTRCGEYIGKANFKRANGIFSVTFAISLIVSVAFMLILIIFINPICSALCSSPTSTADYSELLSLTHDYLLGISFGIPGIFISTLFATIMILDNDKNRLIKSNTIMTAFNIAGDLINVFIFHGGMLGMALATSVSYYIATFILALHFFKKDAIFHISLRHLRWNEIGKTILMGLPNAVTRGCKPINSMVINNILLGVASSTAVAAYSVQNSIFGIFGALGAAISMSTSLVAGVIYGEQDIISARKLVRVSIRVTFWVDILVSAMLIAFTPFFVSLFLRDPTATALTIRCVRFFAVVLPFYKINVVFMSYLQGTHKIALSNFLGVLETLVYLLPLAAILGHFFGTDGIWTAFILTEILVSLTIFVCAGIYNKRIPHSIDDFTFLPNDFGVPLEDRYDISINDMEQVKEVSQAAREFCNAEEEKGNESASLVALCVKEVTENIITYGFDDGKVHYIDLCVMKTDEDFIIRIRDDCKESNPKDHVQYLNPDDPDANSDFKKVFYLAKDVKYINILNMNNLIIRV